MSSGLIDQVQQYLFYAYCVLSVLVWAIAIIKIFFTTGRWLYKTLVTKVFKTNIESGDGGKLDFLVFMLSYAIAITLCVILVLCVIWAFLKEPGVVLVNLVLMVLMVIILFCR